jgi:hypothetical protein
MIGWEIVDQDALLSARMQFIARSSQSMRTTPWLLPVEQARPGPP